MFFSNLFIGETRENAHGAMLHGNKTGRIWVVLIISVKDRKIPLSRGHLDQSNLVVWRAEAITLKIYEVMLALLDWEPWSYADGYSKRITASVFESCLFSWQNGST